MKTLWGALSLWILLLLLSSSSSWDKKDKKRSDCLKDQSRPNLVVKWKLKCWAMCTTYNHRYNFHNRNNGKGIHDSEKEGEPSHWQLFHFHSTFRFWNDNLQVDHTWSFAIPSHVRQSIIWCTRPKRMFVELEVPIIGPHALDEISNWYEFHFQAFEWGTGLPLKHRFLKWWSIAFNLEF